MNLGIRHLRYFTAVAEELSFTRAAERLHMAQPPLSRAIRELEKEIGVVLFNRTTRSVELTPAGTALLEESQLLLQQFESAITRTQQVARSNRERIRIGFRPAASLPLLEPVVREFRDKYPAIAVEPIRIEWSDQVQSVLDGRTDVVFAMGPIEHPEIELTPLIVVPRAVATPNDHPLASRDSVEIAELSPYALAIPDKATDEWAEFWTASPRPIDPGVPPAPRVSNADESLALVLSDQALVVAIHTVRSYYRDSSISIVPITDIEPAEILLAYRRTHRSRIIEMFCEVAAEVASSIDTGSFT